MNDFVGIKKSLHFIWIPYASLFFAPAETRRYHFAFVWDFLKIVTKHSCSARRIGNQTRLCQLVKSSFDLFWFTFGSSRLAERTPFLVKAVKFIIKGSLFHQFLLYLNFGGLVSWLGSTFSSLLCVFFPVFVCVFMERFFMSDLNPNSSNCLRNQFASSHEHENVALLMGLVCS